jgi:hypothetical protein
MKQPRIPLEDSNRNCAAGGFAAAIRQVVSQALNPSPLKPAPIGRKNRTADPPGGPGSGKEPAPPAHQIQLQDSGQPIPELANNHKSPPSENGAAQCSGQKKSVCPPIPPALVDSIADRTLAALPALESKLLAEGVIAEPILPGLGPVAFPEEVTPQETIGCKIQLRLALQSEAKGAPASACFDRDPSGKFCRLLVVYLNVANPATCSYLEKGNASGIGFFAAAVLARCLSRDPSVLVHTLLAQVITLAGLAPNQQITTVSFARRLAKSTLQEPIKALPIFGQASANAVGRSFPLAEIDVGILLKTLGPPWDRGPSERKDNHEGTWLD